MSHMPRIHRVIVGALILSGSAAPVLGCSDNGAVALADGGSAGGDAIADVGAVDRSVPDTSTGDDAPTASKASALDAGAVDAAPIDAASGDGDGSGSTGTLVSWTGTGQGLIALNATDLYFTHGTTLARCAKPDCAGGAATIATVPTEAHPLALDSTSVYFLDVANVGTLFECALPGCAGGPKVLGSGLAHPSTLVLDLAGADVYFNAPTLLPGPAIESCPLGGCPDAGPALFVNGERTVALASDGSKVYWITGTGTSMTLSSCALPGCSGGPVAFAYNLGAPNDFPASITVDATNVYWSVYREQTADGGAPGGRIMKCALPLCAGGPVTLVDGQVSPGQMALAGGRIYWSGFDLAEGYVRSCTLPGCSDTADVASSNAWPMAVQVDGASVYYLDIAPSGGALKRVPAL